MITNIYIDGVQVNNSNVFLSDIGNIGSADVEFSEYIKGGISGQALSYPLKRGMKINLAFEVFSNSYSTFYTQRDRLIRLLQNKTTTSDYLKTLTIELQNGVKKSVDVLFTQVSTGISSNNILHQSVVVTAVSEKEYLQSDEEYTKYLLLQNMGGMTIPLEVPMDMSSGAVATRETLTNNGNSTGFPSIVIYGAFASGFSLLNITTGQQLDYVAGIDLGDTISIDTYNRTIIDDDNASKLAEFDGDWISLTNGDNVLQIIGAEGDTGYAIVTYNDYYINI